MLDAIDAERAGVVRAARDQLGDYTRNSLQVREMVERVIPSLTVAQVTYALRDPNFHWCGVCALSALHIAGITDRAWKIGSGFARGYLPVTKDPKPGDVFIGPPKAYHHGIVVERSLNNGVMFLRSVEGNAGDKATCIERYRAEPRGLTYYSVEPLILAKLGAT